ncbi:adenine-specific methyltransferase EcoRI family protein [Mycoplasma sp. 4423]
MKITDSQNKNNNLHSAKRAKNDEFFTLYEDVANEIKYYENFLQNKHILFPCDYDYDTLKESQKQEYREKGFVNGINDNFAFSRFFNAKNQGNDFNKGWNNILHFSSYNPETNEGTTFQTSIPEFAKKHPYGVVITNPPFSLLREFINLLIENNLKFLIIGNKNGISYKDIFKLIKENKVWLGITSPGDFVTGEQPTKSLKGLTRWFTNIENTTRETKLMLSKSWAENPEYYQKYDNYNAINVNKVIDIPYDYDGAIGVPITFLDKYNPDQFEIIGKMSTTKLDEFELGYPFINKKRIYSRIIIKNKNPQRMVNNGNKRV